MGDLSRAILTSYEFLEHHSSRQCEQEFQKRGQLSCITRASGTLHFCCDRIGCLPDRSVYMDVLNWITYWRPKLFEKKMSSSSTKNYCICPSPFFVNKPIIKTVDQCYNPRSKTSTLLQPSREI